MLVVKVGGSQGIDLDAVCADAAKIVDAGQPLVLVHGGSHETNLVSTRLGKPPRFVTSVSGFESRYTDRETLEIFEMVYAGKTNKGIVERLQQRGVNALGLSGVDGRLLEGPRKDAIRIVEDGKKKVLRDDFTGRVERVNVDLVRLLMDHGYTLVICPPAISFQGEAINVDGDRAAAVLAASLQAECLVILSNVPGLLADLNDAGSLISSIPRAEVASYMPLALGRMKKKLMGAAEALEQGVGRVVFADARVPSPIRRALDGLGTTIA